MIRSALSAAGPEAGHIAGLWWLMFWTCLVVLALVTITLLIALTRARVRGEPASFPDPLVAIDPRRERRAAYVVITCVAATVIILFIFLIASAVTGHRLALLAADNALTIKLTGYRWWWRVQYTDPMPVRAVTTANEIHIPVGRPVLINLDSQDVIHSLWVPPLHGKKDLVPGHPSAIWIQADRPGRYEGQCAEFCGVQHAHMRLLVIAEPPEQFDAWLEAQRQPAKSPEQALAQRGRDVFVKGPCALCHTIRGTDAAGQVAPDLTHLASRATIGAATLPNSTGNLAGWIIDSQHIKPGNAMPPNSLSAEDLQALLAYLGGLT